MDVPIKPATKAGIGMSILLSSLSIQAAEPYPPVPGSYRPTSEYPGQAGTGNTQQFVPSANRAPQTAYRTAPQQPAYYPAPAPPPTYNNRPTIPGFNMNPGSMMNGIFGSGTNSLPYGYPPEPLAGHVAPVYDPPLPAASQNWADYGSQPAVPAYPQQPAASTDWQPAVPQPDHAQEVAPAAPPEYSSQSGTNPEPITALTQPATRAPRPFSNPQETGNAFLQRPISTSFGRNDNRFRPPELKGTP